MLIYKWNVQYTANQYIFGNQIDGDEKEKEVVGDEGGGVLYPI